MDKKFETISITDICFLTPKKLEDIWLDTCPGCKQTVSAIKHDFSLCTQLQNALYRIRQLENTNIERCDG